MNVNVAVDSNLFTKRGHNQVMNLVFRESLEFVRDVFWPIHFTTQAFSRYGDVFQRRSKKWQMKKARVKGHQRPNEYTGRLKNNVLNQSVIRATAKRGSLTAKSYFPLSFDRRQELEVVNDDEQQRVAQLFKRLYVGKAKLPEFRDKVRQRKRG